MAVYCFPKVISIAWGSAAVRKHSVTAFGSLVDERPSALARCRWLGFLSCGPPGRASPLAGDPVSPAIPFAGHLRPTSFFAPKTSWRAMSCPDFTPPSYLPNHESLNQ